ncbi:MAG: hypothetical protein ABI367_08965 [Mucilaginibacter sp.]
MKSNLFAGIILIGAAVLSSCSSTTQLTKTSNPINDDDVYYTKAKAGDRTEYINDADYLASQQGNEDDDYYYYGDYASRINRFGYYSPFDYGDPLYYGYSPYYGSRFSMGLGMGLGYGSPYYSYGYSPYFDLGYGYSPFYDGYGYGLGGYGGYGLGYGGGYGIGGYGGGFLWGGGTTGQRSRPVYANGNNPIVDRSIRSNLPSQNTTILRGNTSQGRVVNGVMQRNADGSGARAVRDSRPQQDQPIFRAPQNISTSNNSGGNFSSGSSGGSSGGGGGGGGRPVRP